MNVVDVFEGDRVRHISRRAKPIVDMLFDASDDVQVPTFGLENLNDQSFSMSQSSRCSSELADLLLPLDM